MKTHLLILSAMVAACAPSSKPQPPTKINSSGVLKYHWSKGWLVNTPSRRVALTCSHSNPSTGTKIGFKDSAGVMVYGEVAKTFKPVCSDGSANDVTVLLLTAEAPPWALSYDFAPKVSNGDTVRVITQNDTFVSGRIKISKDSAIVDLENPSGDIIAGDSGLPWFDSKGKIVSHNKSSATGIAAFGPLYSSPILRPSLDLKIQEAESLTK